MTNDEMIENWRKEEEQRERRVQFHQRNGIRGKTLYLYESGPLDHWENWNEYYLASNLFYKDELRHGTKYGGYFSQKYARDNCLELERLLLKGAALFPYIFRDLRGESIKFILLSYKPDPLKLDSIEEMAIALKADNNGDCYCFTHAPGAESHIPHDFGDTWVLKDCNSSK